MDDDAVDPSESPEAHAPPLPTAAASQSVRQHQMPNTHPISPPGHPTLRNDPRPIGVPHTGVGYATAVAMPVAEPMGAKSTNYQTRDDTTGGVPQLVLTNFKIEFTCTTCGALNQSFYPNQGNVTGGAYMGHHAMPTPDTVARHANPSSQGGPDGTASDVTGNSAYLNARVIHNPWEAAGLGYPWALQTLKLYPRQDKPTNMLSSLAYISFLELLSPFFLFHENMFHAIWLLWL
ncbi:hypothetical protein N7470_001526 [Penicillium chermesinum]|nr:hypothetical protein N7470_001526 [Penicillium chermesinum]